MLERLVLKKYAECTSQRLKRTSGARVVKQFESFARGKNLELIKSRNLELIKSRFLGVHSPYEEILHLLRLATLKI